MSRNIYVILYIASIIVSSLIGYFSNSVVILLLCLFVTRFAVNFYYGNKLQVNAAPRVFSSIFSSIGFLFLMGYDKSIIGAWEIFISGLKIYKKNFWYLLTYVIAMILINIVLVLLFGLFFGLTGSLLSGTTSIIVRTILFAILIVATIVFNIIIYLASLIAVKEAYSEQADFGNFINNIKTSYKYFWKFVGAAILKFIVANGPLVIGMLGFIIFSLSSVWTTLSGGALPTSLLKPSVFSIITGVIVIYGIFHSFYFLLRLVFYVYAIIFENKKTKESLYYSMGMTKNKWWQLLWRIFIPTWLIALASILIIFSIQYIVPSEAIAAVVGYIIQILIWPLSFIFPYMLYENIRSGKTYSPSMPTPLKKPVVENVKK